MLKKKEETLSRVTTHPSPSVALVLFSHPSLFTSILASFLERHTKSITDKENTKAARLHPGPKTKRNKTTKPPKNTK